jgi:hypothetical protein
MNIQHKPGSLIPETVTTGPLTGSRKIYHEANGRADIRVPFREIALDPSANEPPVRVYDASGPYTEADVQFDLSAGLPRPRTSWIARRAGLESYTGRAVKPARAKISAASKRWTAPPPRSPMAKVLGPTFPPSSRRNSCAAKSRAAGRSFPLTSTIPNSSR